MYKKRLRKKGAIFGLSISELMGTIFAVSIIIIMIYAGVKLGGIFGSPKETASRTSYEALATTIDRLLDSKEEFITDTIVYNIEKGYFVLGWDKRDPFGTNKAWKTVRPPECGGEACLCFYGESTNVEDVKLCRTYFSTKDIYFRSTTPPSGGYNTLEPTLYYYGYLGKFNITCGGWLDKAPNVCLHYLKFIGNEWEWGPSKPLTLYVEKLVDRYDRIYIFVTENTGEILNRPDMIRKDFMKKEDVEKVKEKVENVISQFKECVSKKETYTKKDYKIEIPKDYKVIEKRKRITWNVEDPWNGIWVKYNSEPFLVSKDFIPWGNSHLELLACLDNHTCFKKNQDTMPGLKDGLTYDPLFASSAVYTYHFEYDKTYNGCYLEISHAEYIED